MRKKSIFNLLLILMVVGILYYWISASSYQTSEEVNNFPLPKDAQLVYKTDQVQGYEWEKASFENGVPFSYKMVITLNRWKKVEQEGGNTTYRKGNYTINLLSDTDYIEVTKDL